MSQRSEHDSGRDDAELPEPGAELAALLDAQATPTARPEFARELRARFVAGDFADADDGGAAPRATPPLVVERRSWWRRKPTLTAAAAAAFLSAFLGPRLWRSESDSGPGPAWEVLSAGVTATVTRDGEARRLAGSALAEAILSGARVQTSEGELRLRLDGRVLMELGPGTDLTFAECGADAGSAIRLGLASGRLAAATGAGFEGSRLVVEAPDAEVVVTGTGFGIDVYDMGTCVCVTEGEVEVRPLGPGQPSHAVGADHSGFVFRDGSPMVEGDARPDHTPVVERLVGLAR